MSDDVRARTDQIIERLRNDAEFRQSVQISPEATLRAAGLPEELLSDFAQGMGTEEVQGYQFCGFTCVKNTSECTKSYLV